MDSHTIENFGNKGILAIGAVLAGQNRGPYTRNRVYQLGSGWGRLEGAGGFAVGAGICNRSDIFSGGSGIFVAGAGFTVRPIDKQFNNIWSVATIWL